MGPVKSDLERSFRLASSAWFWPSCVGSYDDVSCHCVGHYVFPERPLVAIYVVGQDLVQDVCGSSEQGSGSGSENNLEIS